MRWSATWSRLSRSGRIVVAGATSSLVLCGVLVAAGLDSASADINPSAGVEVPADELQMLSSAAASCPALTPPRLAGQLMANSGFNAKATREGGGSGLGGLTEQSWQKWAPWPGAQHTAVLDNIVALAHQMCDFVGQIRASKVGGDPWRLALASFHVGVPAVTMAGGVPTGVAADYVAQVESYTNWYERLRQFGGAGDASASASSGSAAIAQPPARPVPDAYVQQVLAAGSVCPVVTPPRIAAQLMAQSGFNPNKLSSAGQEGVAQFRIQEWSFYNVKPEATPWEPGEAILVLGRAMCDLVKQVGTANRTADPYAGALTAYEWGVTSVAQAGGVPADADRSLIAQVNGYLPYYTADRRLSPATPAAGRPVAPPPPPAPPNPRPSVTAPPPAPGTHGAYAPIQAESHTAESGSTVESCTDTGGGQDVGHLSTGDWLTYDKVDFGSDGAGRFLVRLASGLPSGMSGLIEVRLDAQTNAPVGSAAVSGTGGWQSWMTVPANISRVTGVHTVYLTFVSSSGWEIANINWFTFEH